MPGELRPWTRRILELLEEGPLPREEIVQRTIPYVPQGHAFRAREYARQKAMRYSRQNGHALGSPKATVTPGQIHEAGARIVIKKALQGLVDRGTVVRDGDMCSLAACRTEPNNSNGHMTREEFVRVIRQMGKGTP
jgi:hypothetical protein